MRNVHKKKRKKERKRKEKKKKEKKKKGEGERKEEKLTRLSYRFEKWLRKMDNCVTSIVLRMREFEQTSKS